jgi:ABC-type Fe3+/spermidine/putrescine transport system ATPase subunit
MEAAVMGDRIGVMIGGVIEQTGTPFEIFRKPKTDAVAKFVKQSLYDDFTAAIAPDNEQ